jgi:hypothetical protein
LFAVAYVSEGTIVFGLCSVMDGLWAGTLLEDGSWWLVANNEMEKRTKTNRE